MDAFRSIAWDLVTALFLVTIVYVLVRPQSRAADAVKLFGDGIAALVRTATDL